MVITKKKLFLQAFAVLSSFSIIFDVVTPLSRFSLHSAIFFFCAFSVSLLLRFIPYSNRYLQRNQSLVWYWPFGSLAILSTVVMLGIYVSGKMSPDERGILSQHVAAVNELQQEYGFIKKDVQEIAVRTSRIDEKIASLTTDVVSDDPRIKLANQSVEWSLDAYDEAIRLCDIETITLFLDGGMRPTAGLERGRGGIRWLMHQDTPKKYEVFDLLLSKELNTDYVPVDYSGSKKTIQDLMAEDPVFLELLLKHGLSRRSAISYCDKGISSIEEVYAHPCYTWPTADDLPEKRYEEIIRQVVGRRNRRMNEAMADWDDKNRYNLICKNTLEMNQATEKERQENLVAFSELKKELQQ